MYFPFKFTNTDYINNTATTDPATNYPLVVTSSTYTQSYCHDSVLSTWNKRYDNDREIHRDLIKQYKDQEIQEVNEKPQRTCRSLFSRFFKDNRKKVCGVALGAAVLLPILCGIR